MHQTADTKRKPRNATKTNGRPRADWAMLLAALCAVALILAGARPFAWASEAAPDSPAARRPNIVLILADDLGWTDLGCFGSRYYETPNIDRLAAQGMRFTSAYSNGPNCAPTRACLMSGRYGPRHGVFTVGDPVRGPLKARRLIPVPNNTTLALENVTLAEALKPGHYVSAAMGKWHLGGEGHLPTDQGFDLNVGGSAAGSPAGGYYLLNRMNLPEARQGEYLTDHLTDRALEFINAHREGPFFLYQAYHAVHTPIQPKPDYAERFARKPVPPGQGHNNPRYAAMIQSLDEGVGRILAKLDELGLTESTLVIFTSDNGGVGGYRAAGVPAGDITSNAPLRGGKGMLYEGGIRVPMIVRWPGVVEPGSRCDVPVVLLDLYPTLVEAAGLEPPQGHALDGCSLVPLLRGGESLERKAIFFHFPAYLQAGGLACRTTPAGAVRAGEWKLLEFFEDGRLELYDLEADIGEQHNLAEKLPEKTSELHQLLLEWRRQVKAPMPRPNPDYDPDFNRGSKSGGKGRRQKNAAPQ